MLNLKNFLRASNSSYIARGYTSNNSNKFSKPVVESLQGGTTLEEPTPGMKPHANSIDARESDENSPLPGPTLKDLEGLSADDLGGDSIGEQALGNDSQSNSQKK